MDIDKSNTEALNAELKNTPLLYDEDLTAAVQPKKHSKPKKKDSAFLYGNEMAEMLKSNQSPEQKLKAVCDKYSETLHANRKLTMANKMAEGRIVKLQHENEQCQQQRSKAVLTRSRLENLCRELQKLNKAQKEEIDLKLRSEEEKRKEISATFQSAFAEINTLTNQNTEKNTKIREENLEMREKIKSVRERVELGEQQLEKVRQRAQLELQLAEARIAMIKMEMTAEKESLLKEKQQLLLKLTEHQVKISELQSTEAGLRSQISMYTEKYDEFQNALTKSNELFSGFNEEMEKMSKKILKLEKETSLWKQRWEKSHAALSEMTVDKQARDTEMEKLTHKLSLLQELCKAFQRERAELLAQLRATNATTTTSSSDNSKISSDDMKKIEADLALSHDSLIESVVGDKTSELSTVCLTEEPNNSTELEEIKNESDLIKNIELIVESSCDSKTLSDKTTMECNEEKQEINIETNDQKENSEELQVSDERVQQIEVESNSIQQENRLNDVDIHLNELPASPQINENQINSYNSECNESNNLCLDECVNDKIDNSTITVVPLDQCELKSPECNDDIKDEKRNVNEEINSQTVTSITEHLDNKNCNKVCMVMEDKKEVITKQNNSCLTKKSSGKRKKK